MNRFDPRTVLTLIVFIFIIVFALNSAILQLLISALLFFLAVMQKYSLRRILYPVRFLIYFLPLTFLIHFFFTIHGYRIFTGYEITLQELSIPVKFTFRLWNIVFITAFSLRLFRGSDLIDGINLLTSPLRRRFVFMDHFIQVLNISLRFFPLIREEYEQVALSEKIFHLETPRSLGNRIRRLKEFLPSVIILSLRRAENLALAMELRGYGIYFPRTDYYYRKLPNKDKSVILGSFIVLAAVLLLRDYVQV